QDSRLSFRQKGLVAYSGAMIRLALSFCLAAILLLALPAWAADTKDKLKAVEGQMSQRKAEEAPLPKKAHQERVNFPNLKQQLVTASDALAQKQEEQKRLEDKQDELADDIAEKTKSLADEKRKLGMLVMALLELGRRPPETLMLQSGLTIDH